MTQRRSRLPNAWDQAEKSLKPQVFSKLLRHGLGWNWVPRFCQQRLVVHQIFENKHDSRLSPRSVWSRYGNRMFMNGALLSLVSEAFFGALFQLLRQVDAAETNSTARCQKLSVVVNGFVSKKRSLCESKVKEVGGLFCSFLSKAKQPGSTPSSSEHVRFHHYPGNDRDNCGVPPWSGNMRLRLSDRSDRLHVVAPVVLVLI